MKKEPIVPAVAFPLGEVFAELNRRHFDGFLDEPELRWNSRLRSSAGRFFPGRRSLLWRARPKIEIASYLLEEEEAVRWVSETMAHEMIHYWLWVRRKPYGHTAEFDRKRREMGACRYNPVPRRRPARYVYICPGCGKEFEARKKLGVLACSLCCKQHAGGRYDVRFRLELARTLAKPPATRRRRPAVTS